MTRFGFVAALALLANPLSAATMAAFDISVAVTLQTDPGDELVLESGFLPSPSSITRSGAASIVTGDDNNGVSCCSTEPFTQTTPTLLGEAALDATGSLTGPGMLDAFAQRRAVLGFGNFGANPENVTVIFDISMVAEQLIDPAVGGSAASGGSVDISRDGTVIYSHTLSDIITAGSARAVHTDQLVVNFTSLPTDTISTDFRISITGGIEMNADGPVIAPVPLPAGGGFLLVGLAGLALVRRKLS